MLTGEGWGEEGVVPPSGTGNRHGGDDGARDSGVFRGAR